MYTKWPAFDEVCAVWILVVLCCFSIMIDIYMLSDHQFVLFVVKACSIWTQEAYKEALLCDWTVSISVASTMLDVFSGLTNKQTRNCVGMWLTSRICVIHRVATRSWKFLKVLEIFFPFFQDLESPWKCNRALKVLEFDERGPWKSLNFNTSESSLTTLWRFCSHYVTPQCSTPQLHFTYLIGGLLKYC